ncbi:Potassium transport system, membrane component TrkH [Nitrospina gracilis 3/211]|uniref:Potassium transport system, membrane component TrkH n=1 Tax=Nitrospina gracilis (strain 3/211) TaxID=1266370 RepID=M1Z370_NITG3|nr:MULTISPECIES: TrkH family potassium uptake protein [Nitrospina]MCF8722519.1 trk system potassium uptake protein TrkH [Nitrospina sp. Nb-3]CCQ91950.1 Potassium transport system, membrane component TrkH [Nitrospina gracilis 3/211]
MNLQAIFNVVGVLLILLGAILIVPLLVSLYYLEPGLHGAMAPHTAFLIVAILSVVVGSALWKYLPSGIEKLREREGFAIVGVSWVSLTLVSCLPLYLTGACPSFVDAFFETMSGFTTTGASVLSNIDDLPHGVLFWRNLMQWMGGMGIIMLSLAIFPALGIGSFQLFKAEIPGGATVERMQPRLAETAKLLWTTYLVLTVAEIALLVGGGMGWFDAVCHTFSTVATGGFSPHQESVGHFNNLYFEMVIITFMYLGGVNFALHYHMVHRNWDVVTTNPELRFYTLVVVLSVAAATVGLWAQTPENGVGDALRRAAFNVVSINTTTGYATDDFTQWPDYLQVLLVGLMMMGACAGSTSGSFKAIRVIIILKVIYRELQKLVHPRAVISIKVGQRALDSDQVTNVLSLWGLFFGLSGLGYLLLSILGVDNATSLTGTIACLFNIGPGLGAVGPAGDYSSIPAAGKWILSLMMLLGRLEIYGILLLFMPVTWRK